MNADINFIDADREAAWVLYVELITRTAIQPLPENYGTEPAALESLYSIFAVTRDILKEYGRQGQTFSKIAVIVLNQILRPFTSKWHRIFQAGPQTDLEVLTEFRQELSVLQLDLRKFATMLAEIAEVEDITSCFLPETT